MELQLRQHAWEFLRQLGAPPRLILHVQLVAEAADALVLAYRELGLEFDERLLQLGVALHDVGKVRYPAELSQAGHLHEEAGRELLLQHGIAAELAQICVSHGNWQTLQDEFEALSVALADKLWKGKRVEELEQKLIALVAQRLNLAEWEIMLKLDPVFETIAAAGDERLARSRDLTKRV